MLKPTKLAPTGTYLERGLFSALANFKWPTTRKWVWKTPRNRFDSNLVVDRLFSSAAYSHDIFP